MDDNLPEPTHVGWFLFCPVYASFADNPEVPEVWARWGCLEPLLSAAHWCQAAMIGLLSNLDPDYEPAFVLRLREVAK